MAVANDDGSYQQLSKERVLVVGAGSIGQRHSRVLEHMGMEVKVVSRRHDVGDFDSLEAGLTEYDPSYVVIARETESHLPMMDELQQLGFNGRVLVEKPLTHQVSELKNPTLPDVFIGYQFRFHPAVRELKRLLSDDRILSAQIRAGQYLPEWRPGRDYRLTESAGPGGGVLLDLSHEIDLVHWLLGPAKVIFGKAVRTGTLEVECEDLGVGILELENGGLVSIEVNYLDRVQLRSFTITTPASTYVLDLNSGSLTCNGQLITQGPSDRNTVLAAMHGSAMSDGEDLCTVFEAQIVVDQALEIRGDLMCGLDQES